MNTDPKLRRLVATALFCAMGLALGYLNRLVSGMLPFRIDLEGLPVLVCGSFFGPFYSGAASLIIDLLGCLSNGYAPFWPITVVKVIRDIILGFFLYGGKFRMKHEGFGLLIAALVCDIALMTPAKKWYYGASRGIGALLLSNSIFALVNTVLRFVFCIFVVVRVYRVVQRRFPDTLRVSEENE